MGRTARKRQRKKVMDGGIPIKDIVPKDLIKWSLNNGLTMDGITPRLFSDTGRGLMTTKNIYPPKVIVSVPLHIMITYDHVWDCPIIRKLCADCHAKDAFIIFLLLERMKQQNSYYFHYMKNLPVIFTTPAYITEKELHLLPDFLKEEVQRQKRLISDIYRRLKKDVGKTISEIDFTVNDVRWAWNVINTRSVYFDTTNLKCYGKTNVSSVNFALLPILDLLNHNSTANIIVKFEKDNKTLDIITNDYYKAGEQMFINYGPHGNRTLICEYGFILPKNIHSQIPLSKDFLLDYFNLTSDSIGFLKNLPDLGVNLEKMFISVDGFNWNLIYVVHLVVNRKKNTGNCLSRFDYIERCCGPCVISDILNDILLMLIKRHQAHLSLLANHSSPAIDSVQGLLLLEIELMQSVFFKISEQCLLD